MVCAASLALMLSIQKLSRTCTQLHSVDDMSVKEKLFPVPALCQLRGLVVRAFTCEAW